MGFGFLILHMGDSATDGKFHGVSSVDIGNDTHPILWQEVHVSGNGIGHRNIHGHIISKAEIRYFILCHKTQPPHIIVINIGQYWLVELLLLPCKRLKKIFNCGIDKPDAWGFFQSSIKKGKKTQLDKERTEITNDTDKTNDDKETKTIILHFYMPLLVPVGENGQQTVDAGYDPINGISSNSHRSYYKQPLQKILEDLIEPEAFLVGGCFVHKEQR